MLPWAPPTFQTSPRTRCPASTGGCLRAFVPCCFPTSDGRVEGATGHLTLRPRADWSSWGAGAQVRGGRAGHCGAGQAGRSSQAAGPASLAQQAQLPQGCAPSLAPGRTAASLSPSPAAATKDDGTPEMTFEFQDPLIYGPSVVMCARMKHRAGTPPGAAPSLSVSLWANLAIFNEVVKILV